MKEEIYVDQSIHAIKVFIKYKQIDEYIKTKLTNEDFEKFKNTTFIPFKIERLVDGIEMEFRPVI